MTSSHSEGTGWSTTWQARSSTRQQGTVGPARRPLRCTLPHPQTRRHTNFPTWPALLAFHRAVCLHFRSGRWTRHANSVDLREHRIDSARTWTTFWQIILDTLSPSTTLATVVMAVVVVLSVPRTRRTPSHPRTVRDQCTPDTSPPAGPPVVLEARQCAKRRRAPCYTLEGRGRDRDRERATEEGGRRRRRRRRSRVVYFADIYFVCFIPMLRLRYVIVRWHKLVGTSQRRRRRA